MYYRCQNPYVIAHRDERTNPAPENLAVFFGSGLATVRERLFAMKGEFAGDGIVIRKTKSERFAADPGDPCLRDEQLAFVDGILNARFSLCPRGNGAGSLRVQESMALGRAPVILSDDWVPVTGLDWREFAIFVEEGDVRDLPAILRSHESRWKEMGCKARQVHDALFRKERFALTSVEQIADIYRNRRHDERTFIEQWPRMIEREAERSGRQPRWQ